jgi:uncharacterized phage protein gp47/JayE
VRGYSIPAGTASIDIPVEATVEGSEGNADIGTVTLLASSIPAVDFVNNAAKFGGGEEPETDDALRSRFRAFIASLPSAVTSAIEFAIRSVQPGLSWNILRQTLPSGAAAPATFTVIVDDGSGVPPASLLTRVGAAIEPVRALGVTYAVMAPQRLLANISMALTIHRDADAPSVVARVTDAIRAYIDGLPLGSGASFTRLSLIAYTAATEVTNVTEVRVNGGQVDVPGEARQAIRSGIISITATHDTTPVQI